jgi:predicted dinucleotide-binding enzyme
MSEDIQIYPQPEATPVGHAGSDRLMSEPVAVLGTGIMGAPMARNLLKAGFQVRVWNRTADKARALATDGADLAETPADAVREAAFLITMLTDTTAVLAVMGQAAQSVPHAAIWLQTSMDTDAERAARLAEDHGITFVNCPVIGTRETAKQARLVVLASGPADALDRAQPIFDALGTKTVRLEPDAGRATRIKLVANAWIVGLWGSIRAQLSRTRTREPQTTSCQRGDSPNATPSISTCRPDIDSSFRTGVARNSRSRRPAGKGKSPTGVPRARTPFAPRRPAA